MSYTRYLWHAFKNDGIKRAARVAWLIEKYGITKVRAALVGIAVTVAGLYLARYHGVEIGYLIAIAGAFIVGYNDGRHCVCESCDCDDPRMIFDTHEYGTGIHAYFEDGTVETPHDRLYRLPEDTTGR